MTIKRRTNTWLAAAGLTLGLTAPLAANAHFQTDSTTNLVIGAAATYALIDAVSDNDNDRNRRRDGNRNGSRDHDRHGSRDHDRRGFNGRYRHDHRKHRGHRGHRAHGRHAYRHGYRHAYRNGYRSAHRHGYSRRTHAPRWYAHY